MNKKNIKLALPILLILLLIAFYRTYNLGETRPNIVAYSEFLRYLDDGKIASVNIKENKDIEATLKGEPSEKIITVIPYVDEKLIDRLEKNNVIFKGIKKKQPSWWEEVLLPIIPWLLIFGVIWFIMMQQIQGAGRSAMSFGRSKAKLFKQDKPKVTFKDVAGCVEAKDDLQEIIDFLKTPEKFRKLGGRIPKGVILIGPPGTGKTLLARAVAGEADVPYLSISGSDFVEMFVGVGAARVRDLFDTAKKYNKCIIFIDEIDAVGRHRGAGIGGGHDEREQTLNQLLVEMDGFDTNVNIIIIAATNRPDILDPALLRPGRFDRTIVVDRPDVKGREDILKIHTKKITLSKKVELAKIAKGTPGFSGADLENLVNEAALLAARKEKEQVENDDLEEAKDKVLMGPERKSLIISDKEKKITAYHEAGHAIVAEFTPGMDPLHKVTIVPRGRALGVTQHLPEEDKFTFSKNYWTARLGVLMGGRVAEEIIFKDMTTGASNDIARATDVARKMVCDWGMSKILGPISYGEKDEMVFLGRDLMHNKNYSEQTARMIDKEIKTIIEQAYNQAKKLLEEKKGLLIKLAETLLEKEVLDADGVENIIKEYFNEEKKPELKITLEEEQYDDKIKFIIKGGMFRPLAAKISEQVQEVLLKVIEKIKNIDYLQIILEGNTDSVGSNEENNALSKKRSEEIKKILIENNLSEEKIKIKFYGEKEPLDNNLTYEGRANNRRVDIIVKLKQREEQEKDKQKQEIPSESEQEKENGT